VVKSLSDEKNVILVVFSQQNDLGLGHITEAF
jgi:hypothetical protein